MDLLNRLGLAPKKARPVGQNLEKGRGKNTVSRRTNTAIKVLILIVLILLTVVAFPHGDVYQYAVDVGSVWRQETMVAPFDFAIYKDPETLVREREEVRFRTPPIFREIPDAIDRSTANRDTVAAQMDRIMVTYTRYRFSLERGRTEEAFQDSLRYLEMRRNARLKLSPDQWQYLLDLYLEQQPELSASPIPGSRTRRVDLAILQEAWNYYAQMMTIGVMDIPQDSIHSEQIIIRNERERIDREVEKSVLFGLNEAFEAAQRHFATVYAQDYRQRQIASAMFQAVFFPSLGYLKSESINALLGQVRRISPTQGMVQTGDVIVQSNQTITPDIKRKLTSLQKTREAQGRNSILWKLSLGQLVLTLSTYLIFFLYLYLLRRYIFDDNRKVLLVALLFGIIIGLYAIAIRMPTETMYAVPVAIVSVLLTVIFDSRVGIIGTLTLALIGGHLLNYDYEFTYATMFAGTLGVFSVRDIKNRGQFFVSAGLVFFGYLVVLVSSLLIYDTSLDRFLSDLLLIAINSILLVMAYPFLWIFERSFDVTTDLTLLELSDTNRPLLKELGLRAPGTFNHSLQVANLAEAAADAIGANALLTRVGALYHDVGKMLKPEYFVENQRPGENPHDHLKPRMSALIIASHVKEGLELGRQYRLPQRVLRFIPMHHGTTRIEYFYRRAVDQKGAGDPAVLESEFRYPGPRPDSKETGILMLADSVEAASRSLAEPTHKKLETLIDMIFRARIDDGQLDETELTFRDLDQIKETFLNLLLGIYHVRVKYPGSKERERGNTQVNPPPVPGPSPETVRDMEKRGVVGIFEQSIGIVPLPGEQTSRNYDELPESVVISNLFDARLNRVVEESDTDGLKVGETFPENLILPESVAATPDERRESLDLDPERRSIHKVTSEESSDSDDSRT